MSLDPAITREALDSLPINVAVIDDDGTIVWTNRAWRRFADADGDEALADSVGTDYFAGVGEADEYAEQAAEGLRAVLDGGRPEFRLEYPCHSPTEKQWFLMWAAPFEFDGGTYAMVAHFDVTDRVEAERKVAEYAAETGRQRDHLALLNQLVRHDIRNGIQIVMSHAELLRDRVPPDEQEHVDNVLEQADHIVDLTVAVKELEAAITGSEEPSLSPINLGAVLRAEADKIRSAYRTADRTVVVAGTADLPRDVQVRANELLSSVFANLLSNAVIHNDRDEVRIDLAADVGEETVAVTIADNGPGVPESDWSTLFARGEMGGDSPGTGLGLYLVDRLVDLYGGEVWITDNDPRGAVFHVELQRAEWADDPRE